MYRNRRIATLLAVALALVSMLDVQAALSDAWPVVVRADQAAEITMVFPDDPLLATGEGLVLQYACSDARRRDGGLLAWGAYEEVPFTRQDDTLPLDSGHSALDIPFSGGLYPRCGACGEAVFSP